MNERDRDKAHVKMLLNATMLEVCSKYNPPLEKAVANLDAFRSHIETTVNNHGGWQPGILDALLDNLDFETVGRELGDEFLAENLEQLGKMVQACLDKGIDQRVIYEALEEFIEEEKRDIADQHGVMFE